MVNTSLRRASTLLLVTIAFLVGCSSSPPISNRGQMGESELSFYVEDDQAYVSGVLDSSLPQQLTQLIKSHPNVTDLVLVDIPGSLDQAATIEGARMIRRLGLNTHIARTGYVLSGGVDLFLGGVKRTIGPGAGVGVHSWYDAKEWGSEVNLADPVHASYVNFYLAMGVPERFYWFTLNAAPSERVYFLSPEEFYDYELVTD